MIYKFRVKSKHGFKHLDLCSIQVCYPQCDLMKSPKANGKSKAKGKAKAKASPKEKIDPKVKKEPARTPQKKTPEDSEVFSFNAFHFVLIIFLFFFHCICFIILLI